MNVERMLAQTQHPDKVLHPFYPFVTLAAVPCMHHGLNGIYWKMTDDDPLMRTPHCMHCERKEDNG